MQVQAGVTQRDACVRIRHRGGIGVWGDEGMGSRQTRMEGGAPCQAAAIIFVLTGMGVGAGFQLWGQADLGLEACALLTLASGLPSANIVSK